MSAYASQSIKEVQVANPEELMSEYKATGNVEIRNKLVMHYLQYVNTAIWGMRSILISNIPYDDFFNQGVLALMDCIDRYDSARGASFDTYSYLAIRRALLKYLRKQNWLSNRLWDARKNIAHSKHELEQRLSREPSGKELANELQISEAQLGKYIAEISVIDTVSFEDLVETSYNNSLDLPDNMNENEVLGNLLREEMQSDLAKTIEMLPPKQKQVITLYFYENLNLREIGEVLDISPQRVSQIRKKALELMADALKKRGYDYAE